MHSNEAFEVTEPDPIEAVFLDGVALETDAHTAKLVGYQDIKEMGERRILMRVTMSIDTAERLYLALWRALRKGGHWTPHE